MTSTNNVEKTQKIYQPMTIFMALGLAAPHTWAASICPALFGILYCRIWNYPLKPWTYITLFLACVFLQSSVNTINDYVDFIKGTDQKGDHLEENDAVLLYSNVNPKSALKLGLFYLAAGVVLGVISTGEHPYAAIRIGLLGVAVIGLYSGGPHPISYLPVGELISGVVMGGLIPLGICACADGRVHLSALAGSLPLIIGIALIMMSNNGCDIEKDRIAGRLTFPVTQGRERTLFLYRVFLLLWIILLVTESILLVGTTGILCALLLLILARKPFFRLFRLELKPEERILQMKTIAQANLLANGSYCLTLFVFCIINGVMRC